MKKFLEKNNLMLQYLYKFLDDDGQFDELKEMAEGGDIDFGTVNVIGYKFDVNDYITVFVWYEDDSSETGVAFEEFIISFYEFNKFMEENNYEI